MALINRTTRLADAVIEAPTIVPVINRFGIYLGTGDRTVADASAAVGVDPDFFLAILNTFINEEYFPERTLRSFSAAPLVRYLEQANKYYAELSFPTIERHFQSLIRASGTDNNLLQIFGFFHEVQALLLDVHRRDMATWIPEMLDGVADEREEVPDSSAIDDAVNDLIMMFVKMLSGRTEPNLTYAVLTSLTAMARDVKQNNRIRDRILLPLYRDIASLKKDQG